MLTQTRLKELLHYDPETGQWIWRIDRTSKTRAGDVTGKPGVAPYCVIGIDRKLYQCHRLAWFYMTGSWPANEIDHIDRDRHNNRWYNLREATRSQNCANTKSRDNGLPKGVSKTDKSLKNPYVAQISVGRKNFYLGAFSTADEAHAVYLAEAKRQFGNFATAA